MRTEANTGEVGLRFHCTECGKCCYVRGTYAHVYVEDDELRRLAKLTGMTVRDFRHDYTYQDLLGWTQLIFAGEHCAFLDAETNKCRVHEARPVQCRTYPFWRELVTDGRWSKTAREQCEGVGHGSAYSAGEVEVLMAEQESAEAG